jgi:AAT family amino acid transporter
MVSDIAASAMNTVILSTVLSAGNHALFAGTRILYSLAISSQAPKIFARTSKGGVPWPALFATSSGCALLFATSAVGKGELWFWLQNLVGVSNQVSSSTN